jgi:peptidoglycan/xylan/chitin deacetylase (PgdA/CDA1 family)
MGWRHLGLVCLLCARAPQASAGSARSGVDAVTAAGSTAVPASSVDAVTAADLGPPIADGGRLPEPAPALAAVSTREPVVALTFDACPSPRGARGFDAEVFEILRRERVPATVFVSGRWVETHRAQALALAAEPLIELGNHSYDHPPFSRLSMAKARADIERTDRIIASLDRTSVGFRPPFGDWAAWLPLQTGGRPIVLWDVVSQDAHGHVSAPRIVEGVTAAVQPGSIVIFHINGRGPETKKALPEIIRRLRERGLRFARVSELLRLPDATVVRALPHRYRRRIPAATLTAVGHP